MLHLVSCKPVTGGHAVKNVLTTYLNFSVKEEVRSTSCLLLMSFGDDIF